MLWLHNRLDSSKKNDKGIVDLKIIGIGLKISLNGMFVAQLICKCDESYK
jgi:hypothetical protein